MKRIEDVINFTDEGHDLDPIECNASTATTLLPAFDLAVVQPPLVIRVYNSGNQTLWIKSQAASIDNLKKGIVVPSDTTVILYGGDVVYTGEISAIYAMGGANDVYVSWI